MKTHCLASCLLAWGLTVSAVRAEDKTPTFSISYASSGLENITVKDGKLNYLWHTNRQYDEDANLAADTQDLGSYDRHEIEVYLTGKEIGRFQEWMDRNKFFDYPEKYESRPSSYGGAFESGLTVVQGNKKNNIGWTGDSKTPKGLGIAVTELRKMADDIAKSRTK